MQKAIQENKDQSHVLRSLCLLTTMHVLECSLWNWTYRIKPLQRPQEHSSWAAVELTIGNLGRMNQLFVEVCSSLPAVQPLGYSSTSEHFCKMSSAVFFTEYSVLNLCLFASLTSSRCYFCFIFLTRLYFLEDRWLYQIALAFGIHTRCPHKSKAVLGSSRCEHLHTLNLKLT